MKQRDIFLGVIIGLLAGFFVQLILGNLQFVGAGNQGRLGIIVGMALLIPVGLFVSSLLARWFPIFWRFGKFVAVGIMNTAIDAGILLFLASSSAVYVGYQIGGYNVISFGVALINSYFWNKYWVFERKDSKNKYEFIEFISVTLIGLLVNSGIVYYITTLITPSEGLTPDKWLLVAKAAATAITLFWNFIGYKLVVFKVSEKTVA